MRRVIVISDIHLGGNDTPMLGHPELLQSFLSRVAAVPRGEDELELVINGDFIDFLAEAPLASWSTTEQGGGEKLEQILTRNRETFDALGRAVHRVDRFTVLLGNHDLELAYPRVLGKLLSRLETNEHRCLFVKGNEAYRVGDLLVEHGNRYDAWNQIDHCGLRAEISRSSRGEAQAPGMDVCPGSRFVHEVMNPLKAKYAFVDLLKPEDEIVALLLGVLEPSVFTSLPRMFAVARSYAEQQLRRLRMRLQGAGDRPTQETLVSAAPANPLPQRVCEEFRDELASLRQQSSQVLVSSNPRPLVLGGSSLASRIRDGGAPTDRELAKLQAALASKLEGDTSFDESNRQDSYARAAHQLSRSAGARVVVMGHTHLSRDVRFEGGARYVNTGTWADLLRVPPLAIEATGEGRASLAEWLRRLVTNDLATIRECHGAYADIRLSSDLRCQIDERPLLRKYTDEPDAR